MPKDTGPSIDSAKLFVPLVAISLGLIFDVGYFFAIGWGMFSLFSLSEHLVFAIPAIPFAFLFILLLYATLAIERPERFSLSTLTSLEPNHPARPVASATLDLTCATSLVIAFATVSWWLEDWSGFILIAGGIVLLFAGGIGLVRLPEFYTRCHAAGITDTGATLLILLGLMLQAGLSLVTVKLILILMFLFFTSPVATHALAHAAYTSGVRPPAEDKVAELPEDAG